VLNGRFQIRNLPPKLTTSSAHQGRLPVLQGRGDSGEGRACCAALEQGHRYVRFLHDVRARHGHLYRIHSVCARAGLIQRFSLGFRGPICLFAGFLGVKPSVFGAGVAVGAFGTMALQITAVRPRRPCLMLCTWDWAQSGCS
jgi:hypothetical protein